MHRGCGIGEQCLKVPGKKKDGICLVGPGPGQSFAGAVNGVYKSLALVAERVPLLACQHASQVGIGPCGVIRARPAFSRQRQCEHPPAWLCPPQQDCKANSARPPDAKSARFSRTVED